jgi:hypothetical protein
MGVPKTDREKLAPFLADILTASREAGEDPATLAALVMRESGATWAPGYAPKGDPKGYGDKGHGHGLVQIDDRWHGEWLRKSDWWVPLVILRKACAELRSNRSLLKLYHSAPPSNHPDFNRVVLAGYNCGLGRARKGWLTFGDPDHFTAGSRHSAGKGDYSAWVLAKAEDLKVTIPELRTAHAVA